MRKKGKSRNQNGGSSYGNQYIFTGKTIKIHDINDVNDINDQINLNSGDVVTFVNRVSKNGNTDIVKLSYVLSETSKTITFSVPLNFFLLKFKPLR